MKKIIACLLAASLVIFVFASCSNKDEKENEKTLNGIREYWTIPFDGEDMSQYIDLTDDLYVGVEYTDIDTTATDDQIQSKLQALIDEHKTYTDKDTPAEIGDNIVMDFTGYVDDVAFENGAATDFETILGEAGFIEGFEEQIVGHKAGESFSINVTFPENYDKEELNGKPARFDIVLKKVQKEETPSISDGFIAENTEYNTVDEYMKSIKEEVEKQNEASAKVEQKNEALTKILDKITLKKVPEKTYQKYYDDFVNQYTDYAKNTLNKDLEAYVTEDCQSTLEDFYAYADKSADYYTRRDVFFFALAMEKGIIDNLTKDDYDAYVADIADQYGLGVDEFENYFPSEQIWQSLVSDKVMDIIIEKGTELPAVTPEPVVEAE